MRIVYHWQGIDKSGKRQAGVIDAANQAEALRTLRSQNITPIKITGRQNNTKLNNEKIAKSPRIFTRRHKIKPKHIADFLQQLCTLICANIPIVTAIETIASGEPSLQFRKLTESIKHSIESGLALSLALACHPKYFTPFFCNLVNIGEKSGTLDLMLSHISLYVTKTAAQKRKFYKAILYPAVVFGVALLVMAILLFFVIPQFKTMFQGFGAQLPAYTQFVLAVADYAQKYAPLGLGLICSVITLFCGAKKRYQIVKQKVDQLIFKLPFYGKMLHNNCTSHFARILAITFKAGLPILEALELTADTTTNYVYVHATRQIKHAVTRGSSLNSAMRAQNLFPERVLKLVSIGEEAGTLEEMLLEIAAHYEAETNYFIDNLNNLLEPMLVITLGILVGGLVVGMYLPIFRLGNVI